MHTMLSQEASYLLIVDVDVTIIKNLHAIVSVKSYAYYFFFQFIRSLVRTSSPYLESSTSSMTEMSFALFGAYECRAHGYLPHCYQIDVGTELNEIKNQARWQYMI